MKELLVDLIELLSGLPGIVAYLVPPILLLVAGLALAIADAKRAYFPLAVFVGGAACLLVYAADSELVLPYLALYVMFAVAVRLLFLIPFRSGKREDRSGELYEKFHVPLDAAPGEQEADPAEDGELRLAHARALLEKLLHVDLEASDRLEADGIAEKLDGYGEELTEDEIRSLNDCLATILKLTAKYKL